MILDSSRLKTRGQILAIELRVVARPGNSSDVDQLCDAVRLEDPNELLDRPRGMTYGVDLHASS